MSDPGSTGAESAATPKKKVSPARNAIGIIFLIVAVSIALSQFYAVLGYKAAVKALDARSQDEDKGLMQVPEVETLLGKSPDGPDTDFQEGNRTFTKKTYTWPAVLKSYTLTVFYTKGLGPCLHHFVPEGAEYTPETTVTPSSTPVATNPGPRKARTKRSTAGTSEPASAKAPSPTKAAEPTTGEPKPAPKSDEGPAKAKEPAAESSKPAPATAPEPAKEPK
jgi:hypothetical protein